MNSQLIRKDLFEVHKPSGQISAKLTKNGALHQLTPIQFDTINFMCYKSRESMHKKYNGEQGIKDALTQCETDEDAFNFLSNQEFEIDLGELTMFTNTYKDNKGKVINAIKELKDITVEMGMFKKHDLSVEHSFSLLRRYTTTKKSNKIRFRLEPEIMYGWLFTTKPFSKMHLTIQAQLKQTYSKILYENLKDYENQGVVEKPLRLWNYILGFDPEITKAAANVSTLKRDYLNKSIKEINNTTDIFIDSIVGLKIDKEAFMRVTFHKQTCSILDRDIENETTDEAIKKQLLDAMIDAEIDRRYNAAVGSGINVKNEASYKNTIRENISIKEIENQIALNEFCSEYSEEQWVEYLEELSAWYTQQNKGLNIILIYKDYKLIDIFTNNDITKNAEQTVKLFNEFNESV